MSRSAAGAAAVEAGLAREVELAPHLELAEARRRGLSLDVRRELAAVWKPFVGSRLLVFIVGGLTMLLIGVGGAEWDFDPRDMSTSFGRVGDLIAASSVRWDSIYYLGIAHHGYQTFRQTAFFPLYPLLIRIVSVVTGSYLIAGILISLVAMLAALVIVHRLTVLELGQPVADLTVRLLAFGPMAVFLSAVYTESLFLAVSAGAFYAGRRGRWMWAGILGAVAANVRSGGILLLAPLVILFFWGPRSDAPPRLTTARWRPRYPVTAAALWLLLIPIGAQAFNLYFMSRGFGSGAPVRAQQLFEQHQITLPVLGLWRGLEAAWHQVELIIAGTPLTDHPSQALFQGVALLVTLAAVLGMFRRLPAAYGVYTALGALVLSLSAPTVGDPLSGFARYASLRFPLFMYAALWAIERRRSKTVLVGFALLMVVSTVQFANWQVVGTPTL